MKYMSLQEKYRKYRAVKQAQCLHPENEIIEHDYGPGGGIEYECRLCEYREDGE